MTVYQLERLCNIK